MMVLLAIFLIVVDIFIVVASVWVTNKGLPAARPIFHRNVFVFCTSEDRPKNPIPGMMIYETDTNDVYSFEDGQWELIPK